MLVREMQRRKKEVHKFALEPSWVEVLGDDLADKVFPRPGPAVQREDQRLLRAGVVDEAGQRLQDDPLGQVLAEEPLVQGLLQGCGRNSETSHSAT